MKKIGNFTKIMSTVAVSIIVVGSFSTSDVQAKEKIKVAIVSFLSGPAAGPFGVPGRNAAELIIEAINKGKLPAPYNTPGFAGAKLEPIFVDESGGNTKQVAEYRNLVQKRGVDAVIGYISSGSCLSISPIADELKKLTILAVCGTPRIFEEGDWKYVFRTTGNAIGDGVSASLYVRDKFPNAKGYTGINQNYAWGQDSYKFFDFGIKTIMPKLKRSEKAQFPKLFAGQYGTEISSMLLDKSELVHSSFWDGDLEAFIFQAAVRGFFKKKRVIFTLGGTALDRLGKRFPEGVILGTRGEYGVLVRDKQTVLNQWFIKSYFSRYGQYPSSPSYQYAQALLALKISMDKAANKAGGFPSQEQSMAELKGLEFESFGGKIEMSLGNGHQAAHPVGLGVTKWDPDAGEMTVTDVKFYPAKCILPPNGQKADDWFSQGKAGNGC